MNEAHSELPFCTDPLLPYSSDHIVLIPPKNQEYLTSLQLQSNHFRRQNPPHMENPVGQKRAEIALLLWDRLAWNKSQKEPNLHEYLLHEDPSKNQLSAETDALHRQFAH